VKASVLRSSVLLAFAVAMMVVWVFPVAWGLVTSLKTERDVLAYPPTVVFDPTAANYQDVFSGSASIVPNLISSLIVSGLTTALTMLFAIPAAYALARLDLPWKRGAGFWVLATQMLPPVGLVIPYFLLLRGVGWTDTYQGLVLVYLTFALPFAIWLLVSYFEEIPREMEEAALLDRAGRLRALWHVVLPQAKGGIAVTVIFVFLNSWNEFLFAVVLGGNTVRTVTVAMFNFISLEQTQWARLAAAAMVGMAPVIALGLIAQKHIVKGLTVGAVKGGGRR
jgi:ABC-type glycerol-3-phosphate transport system permease component